MPQGISNPTITVDDEVIAIEANTFVFNEGAGTMNGRTQSAGGGAIETVFTEDVTTKRSVIRFGLLATPQNFEKVTRWQERSRGRTGLVIRASEGNFTRAWRDARVINDPDRSTGPDGKVEIEWNAAPAG